MTTRHIFCKILILGLLLGGCNSEKAGTEKTHLGGCILISPVGEVPTDLYQETNIIQTNEYKPFTKKLTVYGITLIGRDDISDGFMKKVAKTIKAMFPRQGENIDAELQAEVIQNMYKYRTVIPLFYGEDHDFAPDDRADWEHTRSQNSICDIIMEAVPGQVNEVVEHILHHVTDVGLHYTFPDEWGVSTTSKVHQVTQEAIDKGYYDVEQYGDEVGEEYNRVLIQEYAYWIIYAVWNLREHFGPKRAEYNVMNSAELKAKLPQSYDLVVQTIPKVMAAPSREMLKEFFEKDKSGEKR